VLAQQHYLTFKERFASYPVQVEMLSRFRSAAEQRITINNLKKGLVDIIIGTHRLLSKDVVFKDLGLLVVDEEQRFGVAHKEKIKMLKANVDVLTMTATPIPRTLQMSLGGVRDLSLIETPPEDRLPVQTYVLEYNPEVVREAILKEIQRGGQVFYVHNRVQTIFRTARYLQGLVPEATFRVAHGQMKEDDLEKVMWEFLNHKFQCLVCTTIIESGLDFPNANTLIVENADWFGLSQLYQLRGRVGRSNRLAYAYFTFNRDKVLTEQAEKRLRALQEFTEFGSGFKLALRDLEIRGAGNILGAEQHGHMAAVGFDLYNQLLQEAVKELRGEKVPEKKAAAPLFDLRVDSYLPDDYIRDGREKVEIYRRLALVESLEEVKELAAELRDRFGRMPDQVVYLFDLALIRVRAAQLGIKDVQHNRHTMAIRFDNGSALHGEQFAAWSRIFGKRLSFSTIAGLEIRIDTRGLAPKDLVKSLKKALISSQQQ
jgi:transcription-repair coupling factor (superfamily II helicase)